MADDGNTGGRHPESYETAEAHVNVLNAHKKYAELNIWGYLTEISGVRSGDYCLDIGCGTGAMIRSLISRHECCCMGIDVDEELNELVRRSFASVTEGRRPQIVTGDFGYAAVRQDLVDRLVTAQRTMTDHGRLGKFDRIFCTFAYMYCGDEIEFLGNVGDLLADGGSFVLASYSRMFWDELNEMHREACGGWLPFTEDFGYGNLRTPFMESLLERSFRGCRIEQRLFKNRLFFPTVEEFLGYYQNTVAYENSVGLYHDLRERLAIAAEARIAGDGASQLVAERYVDVIIVRRPVA